MAAIVIESAQPTVVASGTEGMVRVEYCSKTDAQRDWALLRPAAAGATWVVMVHGHGSHGDQLFTRADIRDHWLPLILEHDLGILSPNLRDNAWMSPAAASDLRGLLQYARTQYGAGRFVFASGSMGGTSNLIYAELVPEDVAGVVALCPATDLAAYHAWCRARNTGVIKDIADAIESAYGGPPDRQPDTYARHSACLNASRLTMPVFVVHGTADTLIPVAGTRRLAAQMADAPNFVYVEQPDGHHDSPLTAMETALEWVLGKIATK